VRNLRLAVPRVDGTVIPPGKRFSFWRAIGPTSTRKGYAEGLVLWKGEARAGVGGGLCQLSNHLHWMALHSPLVVAERHHRFTEEKGRLYRENEIYRAVFDRATGRRLGEELVMRNRGLVKYTLQRPR
jgi:hypothetical protein